MESGHSYIHLTSLSHMNMFSMKKKRAMYHNHRRSTFLLLYYYYCMVLIILTFNSNCLTYYHSRKIVLVSAQSNSDSTDQSIKRRNRERQRQNQQQKSKTRFQQHHYQEPNNDVDDDDDEENLKTFYALFDVYSSINESHQKPRHILQGLAKGLSSSIFGILSGIPFLFGLPVAFAHSEALKGYPGVMVGLVIGTLTSIITTIVGILNGAYQFIIGLWNTPMAFVSFLSKKKVWNSTSNKWEKYFLNDEAESLQDAISSFNVNVSDTTFYDLLGVKPGASTKEIKRGYYAKAKDLHPDKNPDNEETAALFIRIHEAYETLIDTDKRIQYDTLGQRASFTSSSTSSFPLNDFNAGVFFEILFGSQPVEQYVGQLAVSSFFGRWIKLIHANASSSLTMEMFTSWLQASKTQSLQRPVQVALYLRDFIHPLVSGSITEKEFIVMCEKEAQVIADSSFGQSFLYHIGKALVQESQLFLSQSLYGIPLWLLSASRKKIRDAKLKIDGFKMIANFLSEIVSRNQHENIDTSGLDSFNFKISSDDIEEMLPFILDIAWQYNAWDIARLIETSCGKVFFDAHTQTSGEPRKRAKALRLLGDIFLKNSEDSKYSFATQDMKVRAEVAFKIAQQNVRQSNSESEDMIQRAQKAKMSV